MHWYPAEHNLRITVAEDLVDFGGFDEFTLSVREGRNMKKVNEYVKVAEAAEILGVAQNTVRSWAEKGKLAVHRNPANGYRLFRRSELEAFLKQLASVERSVTNKR